MSAYIRRLNAIKKACQSSWLTKSQKAALEMLVELSRAPGTVNLVGGVGVGKTFLAWLAARELNYQYVACPQQLTKLHGPPPKGIIVDNCHFTRTSHRELIKVVLSRQVPRAVFISRRIIQDYTHYVELSLTLADQSQVIWNLSSIGITVYDYEYENLWSIVSTNL